MDLTTRLGLEEIQRQALIVLFNNLNDTIDSMSSTWAIENDEFWSALSRGNQDWTVERIADENFYSGYIPSLISAPINKYPNVCSFCYIATPPGSNDDTGELYNDVLSLNVIVKSVLSEEEVNSRIQKTLDAINLTFMNSNENRTLNNTIPALNAPRQTIGDVFPRLEHTAFGEKWWWQGGSLEYVVNKYVDFY